MIVVITPYDCAVREIFRIPPVSCINADGEILPLAQLAGIGNFNGTQTAVRLGPAGGMKQVKVRSSPDVRRQFDCSGIRQRGKILPAQNKTAFSMVFPRIDHLKFDAVEDAQAGLEHPEIVGGTLIGPAAFAVAGSFVCEIHVCRPGEIQRK